MAAKLVVTPESAAELLRFVEITDFAIHELSGRVGPNDEAESGTDPEILVRVTSSELEVRLRAVVLSDSARFIADIGVIYEFLTPVNLWSDVIGEFVARVGVMAVYPLVREAIFTTAARMRRDTPILGLIRQGDVQAGVQSGPTFRPSEQPVTVRQLAAELSLSEAQCRDLLGAVGSDLAGPRKHIQGEDAARARLAYAQSTWPERFTT